MPYARTTWVDDSAPAINAANLNNIELGLTKAPYGGDFSTNDLPVWNGSAWVALANAGIPIARLADPGTGKVIGSSGGVAMAVNPPGYELGYDQITSVINVASTTEGTPTTIIAGTARTYEAVAYLFEFYAPAVQLPSTTAGQVVFELIEDGVEIGRLGAGFNDITGGQTILPVNLHRRYTPSAGSHTYGVAAFASTTTGTPQVVSGAGTTTTYSPAFLRVTKV